MIRRLEKSIAKTAPILGSSVNPDEIKLRVKGVLIGIIPMAILIGRAFDVEFTESNLLLVAEAIGWITAGVMMLIGWLRSR